MSGAFSYRAPSNPGVEKFNIHIPPKLKENMLKESQLVNYLKKSKVYPTNPYISQSMDKYSNESKHDLENFYKEKTDSKWTDSEKNLKIWEYEGKKIQTLEDVF